MDNSGIGIVFITDDIIGYKDLVTDVQPGTEVVVLDSQQDGIQQINQTLANYSEISSIQILSHGAEGSLQLGTTQLNQGNLDTYEFQIQQWANYLTPDADILLYSCNVAQSPTGEAFVQQLSQLTGADIAASDDLTGNSTQGGDWVLEYSTGTIEASSLLSNKAMETHQGVFASTIDFSSGTYTSQIQNDRPIKVFAEPTSGELAGTTFVFDATDAGGSAPHFHMMMAMPSMDPAPFLTQHNGNLNGETINFTIAREDGEAFDFEGFDRSAGEWFEQDAVNQGFTITGTKAGGGTVQKTFGPADALVTYQTETLGTDWDRVTLVRFEGESVSTGVGEDGNYVLTQELNIDDIVVAASPTPGITIAETDSSTDVTEAGDIDTYTVVLDTQPGDDVNINLSTGPDLETDKTTLTFTQDNWDEPQEVVVNAVDDSEAEGNHSGTISHSIGQTFDPDYQILSFPDVNVNITDNDSAGVTFTKTEGNNNVTEAGLTDTYEIVLNSKPTANVTIDLTTDGETTLDQQTVTFTTSNWDTPQTVTVTATDDTVAEGNHTSNISHTVISNDTTYDGLVVDDVIFNVLDDEIAAEVRINSGGSEYTDISNNEVWQADQFSVGTTNQGSTSSAISGTTNDQLYQKYRWGSQFSYEIPVANGAYEVQLLFAETWANSEGQRVFDISAEGELAIDNLDVFAKAGKNVAWNETVVTEVSDDILNLDFVASNNNAMVSGIKLVPLGNKPTVANPIEDVAVTDGAAENTVINLYNTFQDQETPDADLSYEIVDNNSNPSDLLSSVSINPEGELVINYNSAVNVGSAEITVEAMDEAGLSVTDTFTVTVGTPEAPEVTNAINDVFANGSTDTVIDLLAVFEDAQDLDDLTYQVTTSNSTLLTPSINQRELTLAYNPDVEGTAEVTVTATDTDGLSVETTFNVTVNAAIEENATFYNAGGPDYLDSVNQLWQTDSNLTIGGNTNTGSTSQAISGTEEDGLYQNYRWGSLMEYDFDVENGNYEVELLFAETFFTETNKRIFDVVAEGDTVIENLDVFAETGAKNAALNEKFFVNVSDGNLDIDFDAIANNAMVSGIKFKNVGDKPTVTTAIADVEVADGAAGNTEIDLNLVFEDTETPDTGLIYTIVDNNPNPSELLNSVDIDTNGILSIDYNPNVNIGLSDITVRATDADELFVEDTFTVTVGNPQAPEVIEPIEDVFANGSTVTTIDVSAAVQDPDGTVLTYDVTSSNTNLVSPAIDANGILTLAYNGPETQGEAEILVTATDIDGLSVEIPFIVTVNPGIIEGATLINSGGSSYRDSASQLWQADINFPITEDTNTAKTSFPIDGTEEDLIYQQYRWGQTFSADVPLDNGAYEVTLRFSENFFDTPDSRVFDVALEGEVVLDDLDVFTQAGGKHIALDEKFIVDIKDGDEDLDIDFSASVNNAMISAISIVPKGNIPTVTSIPDVVVNSSTAPNEVIDLAPVFDDVQDGDNLTYVVEQLNPNPANLFTSVTVDAQGQLIIDYNDAVAKGTSDIKVTATDTDGLEVSTTFNVSVNLTDNDIPKVVQPIEDVLTDGKQDTVFNLQPVFEDTQNGDNFTYDVTTDSPNLVTPTITAGELNLVYGPELEGTANVTVTATDTDNLFVEDEFEVIVNQYTPPGTILVNAAGNTYTDTLNKPWEADKYFSPSLTSNSSIAIAGTENDKLYQSYRYDQNFDFTAPDLENGVYQVNLEFSENFANDVDVRVFDVSAEDKLIIDDLDVFAEVGKNTALSKTAEVDVTDGNLTLNFAAQKNNAMISAIEILPLGQRPTVETVITDVTVETSDAANTIISLANVFADADGDELTYSVEAVEPNPNNLFTSVEINQTTGELIIDYNNAVNVGGSDIKVTATDPNGLSVETTFKVVVNPSIYNPPTVATPIDDFYVNGEEATTISLIETFEDTDNENELTYEIVSNSNSAVVTPNIDTATGDLTLSYADISNFEAVELTLSATDTTNLTTEETFTVTVSPKYNPDTIYINTGGVAVNGEFPWEADRDFNDTGVADTYTATITNPIVDAEIYNSHRVGDTFSYAIPVPEDGLYEVTLHFAETFYDTILQRQFSATAEGQSLFTDLDITAEVGADTALSKTFKDAEAALVFDGFLNLEFTSSSGAAIVNAIEVTPPGKGGRQWGPADIYLHVVMDDQGGYLIDYDGDGSVSVNLGGDESHTHEPGRSLTDWVWTVDGQYIANLPNIQTDLSLGENKVELTIQDATSPIRPDVTLPGYAYVYIESIDNASGILTEYYPTNGADLSTLMANLPASPEYMEVITERNDLDYMVTPLEINAGNSGSTIGGSPFSGDTVVKMTNNFTAPTTGSYDFLAQGGFANQFSIDTDADGIFESVQENIDLIEGVTYQIETRFAIDTLADLPGTVKYSIDDGAYVSLENVTNDQTNLAPFINNANTQANPQPASFVGETITLEGVGFFSTDANQPVTVTWDGVALPESSVDVSILGNKIMVDVPAGPEGNIVPLTIETPNGSQTEYFIYDATIPPEFDTSIIQDQATQTNYDINNLTVAEWGPDGRLYVGTMFGQLQILTFDDNYNVVDSEVVKTIGKLPVVGPTAFTKSILGIGFNPFDEYNSEDDPVRVYLSISEIYGNGGGAIPEGEASAYSGEVVVLEGPDFTEVKPVVTGLPVSNHDHAVNGLEFDENGDLLILTGSNTNAGVIADPIGDLPESPFSAAILKADLKPGFQGVIDYQEIATGEINNDQVFGDIVEVKQPVDVSVFASGIRNGLDLVYTTQGNIYATDNGPNGAFGVESTGPDTQADGVTAPDELNLIVEGEYYGSPNRNRGLTDTRQNVYYGGVGEASIPGVYTAPLTHLDSSTNGIVEYRATTFNSGMRGNLLAQKWNDQLYNISLSPDGTAVEELEEFTNLSSSLDVTQGPGGTILGIDFGNDYLTVSTPIDGADIGEVLAYDIFPWRAPAIGGNPFTIGGANFSGNINDTTVTIGGQEAQITRVSGNRIEGFFPEFTSPTGELLDVVITSGGESSTITDAFLPLTASGFVPNNVPTTSGIENMVLPESAPNTVINVFEVFDDVEDTDQQMTYEVSTTNSSLFATTPTINQTTGELTLDYADGVSGIADVIVKATDTAGFSTEAPFTVALASTHNTEAQALFKIEPNSSSTAKAGSFEITNNSLFGQELNRVVIDLRTGMFPDMFFDPDGTAGDIQSKNFTVDADTGLQVVSHQFLKPRDGGFDAIEIILNDFDPGETFSFSVDNDPGSTRGTAGPGPADSASVSGLELTGTQIIAEFSDGSVYGAETYRIPNSDTGSQAIVEADLPSAPEIAAVGIADLKAQVSDASQTIRVTGNPGEEISLLVLESALYTEDGGFDIDPFEANTAIGVNELTGTIGADGTVDIPVTLTKTNTTVEAGVESQTGLNYIVAVQKDSNGKVSLNSDVLVLELI